MSDPAPGVDLVDCPICDGLGWIRDETWCPFCGGTGEVNAVVADARSRADAQDEADERAEEARHGLA